MKNIKILVAFVFIVIIATQPVITSLFINQTEWTNIIATLGYLLISYPVYLIYQSFSDIKESKSQKIEDQTNIINEELELLYNGTKNDFLFFEHEIDQPFAKVSRSVREILEAEPEDFKINYKRFKAEQLFEGVFERAKSFAEKGIRVPLYEVELNSKSGKPIVLEINETPIFDEDKELVKIWMTAHNLEKHNVGIETLSANNTEKYDLLYNNLNDGVFLLKGDRFVDCNSKILDIFGTTLEQILMYSPFSNKFSPPIQPSGKNSKEHAMYKMKLAYEGEAQVFEWTHLKQTGEPFKTQISLVKFDFNKETYLYAIVKDLSHVENLELEINKRNEFIDLLFEQSPIGIIKYDKNNSIINLNKSIRRILNINDEFNQYSLFNLFKKDLFTEAVEASKTEGVKSLTLEMNRYNSNDSFISLLKIIPTTLEKDYNGGLILLEEVSETSELKRALDVKQNNLEEIISTSKDVLYKYNIKNSQYEYVSQSIVSIFGYTAEEFKALNETQLKSLLHPRELNRADQILAKMHRGEQTDSQTIECAIIDKSGHTKWIKDTYRFVANDSGEPEAIVGYIADLTAFKENEMLIKEKDKQIELLSENKPVGIAIVVNNKIQLVNSVIEKMTGYTFGELSGKDYLFSLAHESNKQTLKASYLELISEEASKNEIDFWITTKMNTNICIRNTYYFESGNSRNYCIQTKDVTKLKIESYKNNPTSQLEEELKTYLVTF